jgi:hypothetical protein
LVKIIKRFEVVENRSDNVLIDLNKRLDLHVGQEDRVETPLLTEFPDLHLIVFLELSFLVQNGSYPLEIDLLLSHLVVEGSIDELGMGIVFF